MLEIITITKNDINGLKKTVASTEILREKYNVRQIIIDSSDSDIKKVVSDFAIKEKNIIYLWQEPKGISCAFNYGINNSDADWLWFLNSGDCVNPYLDYDLFVKFLNNSSADTVIFETKDMKDGKILEKKPPLWGLWPPVLSWIPHPSTIVKRKLFEIYGNFDEKYKVAMDYELWIRLFSKNINVDLVSFVVAVFNREGLSNTSNKKARSEVAKIIRRYFWTIIKKELFSLRIILKSIIINLPFVNYKKDMNKDLFK